MSWIFTKEIFDFDSSIVPLSEICVSLANEQIALTIFARICSWHNSSLNILSLYIIPSLLPRKKPYIDSTCSAILVNNAFAVCISSSTFFYLIPT